MENQSTINLVEYEALFKDHYSELCGFANKYLDDLDAAEEIVQSFFVKFWENRRTINIEKAKKSYLFNSIKNACLNQIKHIKIREAYKVENEREMENQSVTVEQEFEAEELNQKIKTSINSLPEGRRKIFIMSRYEGLKYKEIAEKLKISIKTVENQMGSAIKHLKSELTEYLITIILFILC